MTSAVDEGAGYADPRYVGSLSEFGSPLLLPRSSGWLLERPIPGTPLRDAMGPYPLFSCSDWSGLAQDVKDLDGVLVSIVLVADPLGEAEPAQLCEAFPDHLAVLKHHLIRDTERAAPLPEHHRRNIRRAARSVDIEICDAPLAYLDDWLDLYSELVTRHGLVGIRAFSRSSFRVQLGLPGMTVIRAVCAGRTISMGLWLVTGSRAYYHLGASSPAGRDAGASYAVFAAALEHLSNSGVRYVDLGAGSGGTSADDGLYRFKRGWANDERPAYLCGRITDASAYAELTNRRGTDAGWLPAYRASDVDLAGSSAGDQGGGVGGS